jgi:hypothetical protein
LEIRVLPALPRFGTRPSAEEASARPGRWHRRYRVIRLVFCLTLTALAALAWLSNVETQRRNREEGTFVRSDRLTPQDQAFPDRDGRFDGWRVNLVPGQTLRVAVYSAELPPSFYIVGPMALDSPGLVARSENDGADVARTEYSPSQPGDYMIVVFSRRDFGAYDLTTNYRVANALSSSSDPPEGLAAYLLLGVIVLALAQYLALPAYLSWRDPDRILLLRPFGQRRVSRALKRLNRRSLGYRGFTFTLSDKHLKNSFVVYLLAHIPMDLGSVAAVLYRPLFRRMHRFVLIRKPSDLAILRLRLRSRWRLTKLWQSWLGSTDRIIKFRSTDSLWKDCIGILLDSCQVIVVDLSHAGSGTVWELQELVRRGYLDKCVFLVQNGDERAAGTLLAANGVRGESGPGEGPIVHRYSQSNGRLNDPQAFDRDYAAAVSGSRQPDAAPMPTSRKAMLALAPMAVLGPFWSPVGLPLALFALRDLRRSQGTLKGEMAAHFAVLFHGVVLVIYAASFLFR